MSSLAEMGLEERGKIIGAQTHVTLKIYNSSGQHVRTLVNDSKTPGYYSTLWNGVNDKGMQMGTGVYLYKIRAGNFVKSKKMLMIK